MRVIRLVLWVLVAVLSGLVLFGVPKVGYAQTPDTDTPVPTATITPAVGEVMATATPAAPVSDDWRCPTGMPTGYGTVTPSSLWSLACSHCLTPGATITPYAGTAIVGTLTRTPTATATPSGAYHAVGPWQWGMQVPAGVQYAHDSLSMVDEGTLRAIVYRIVYQTYANKVGAWDANTGNELHDGATVDDLVAGTWYCYSRAGYSAACDVPGVAWVAPNHPLSTWIDRTDGQAVESGWTLENEPCCSWPNTSTVTLQAYYVWWGSVVVPTVTATPGGGYCGAIEEPPESSFQYSGLVLDFEAQRCIDVGPYEVEIFGSEVIDFPWLAHVCFLPVSLGGARLFGLYLMLDVYVVVLTGAWLFRRLNG